MNDADLEMNDADLLTVSQVAEAVSASSQTIRNWIRAGQLRGVRIGNRFLIPRGEIDRLRRHVSPPGGESPWEFEPGAPGSPLPRAGDRAAENDAAESLLGG